MEDKSDALKELNNFSLVLSENGLKEISTSDYQSKFKGINWTSDP